MLKSAALTLLLSSLAACAGEDHQSLRSAAGAGAAADASLGLVAKDVKPRNVVMWYFNQGKLTADEARPLVSYVDAAGASKDWLFDAVLLGDLSLSHYGAHEVGNDDAAAFHRHAFADGAGLKGLAEAVRGARVALGDRQKTVKVYFWVPHVTTMKSARSWIKKLADDFDAGRAQWPELELAGFYWGHDEFASTPAVQQSIKAAADQVHAMSGRELELLWIPSFHTDTGIQDYKSFGVDRVALQPNFAFTASTVTRFKEANAFIKSAGLAGAELELGKARNPNLTDLDAELANARAYLGAFRKYGWKDNDLTVFYHGTAINRYVACGVRREIYEGLHQIVAGRPGVAQPADDAGCPALPAQQAVKLTVSGSGEGSVTGLGAACTAGRCSSLQDHAATVTLTAATDGDSTFGAWTGCDRIDAGNQCLITANRPRNVAVSFTAKLPVTLNVVGNGTLGAQGFACDGEECSQKFAANTALTLTATPGRGQTLVALRGCDKTDGQNHCFVTVDKARNVTATFQAK